MLASLRRYQAGYRVDKIAIACLVDRTSASGTYLTMIVPAMPLPALPP
jgi:hypothetical protein